MPRKWEASKFELNFEKYLTDNGYTFEVEKEYQSCTYYLISKDGYTHREKFPHIAIKNMRKYFELMDKTFEMEKEYERGN